MLKGGLSSFREMRGLTKEDEEQDSRSEDAPSLFDLRTEVKTPRGTPKPKGSATPKLVREAVANAESHSATTREIMGAIQSSLKRYLPLTCMSK